MRRIALLLASACVCLAGCGAAVPFIHAHDRILGPLSPAGNVRGAATGDDFEVTAQGVTAKASDQLFRPYPRNVFRRAWQPKSFWQLGQGLQAFVAAVSPLVLRTEKFGDPLDPEALSKIRTGMTSAEVFALLGSPQQWIKRRGGSLMAYRADLSRSLAFYLGVPPAVDLANPTGINPSFRYTNKRTRPYKTILFFDRDERLITYASNETLKKVAK